MFYCLYKITNLINEKIYIGAHKTDDLNDQYMGSGVALRNAIKKYGIENFKKEVIEIFDSQELMYQREREVVNESFIARNDVYNIKPGGYGGWDYVNYSVLTKEHRIRGGKKFVERARRDKLGVFSDTFVSCFSTNREIQQSGNTPEARKKASVTQKKTYAAIEHQKGGKNSQFGTMWITDGTSNKKIKKKDSIPDGWRRGRVKL